MISLFLDANVYLSFYHYADDDVTELEKILDLISEKEIKLYLPEQTKDEVRRNREAKISDALSTLDKFNFTIRLPRLINHYPESKEIKKSLHSAQGKFRELRQKCLDDAEQKRLKADVLIEKLFKASIQIPTTEDLYKTAKKRMSLGMPPGKNRSIGDAINWEALISTLDPKENVVVVSDDKDFKSVLDPTKINQYLLDEWSEKKDATVFFYLRIKDFFEKQGIDISLEYENKKNNLVNELRNSGSFQQTHKVVGNLGYYNGFDDSQLLLIAEALIDNSQVRSISTDGDVYRFYSSLNDEFKNHLKEETYKQLSQILFDEQSEENNETDFLPF